MIKINQNFFFFLLSIHHPYLILEFHIIMLKLNIFYIKKLEFH